MTQMELKFLTCKLLSLVLYLSTHVYLSKSSDDFLDCITLNDSDIVFTHIDNPLSPYLDQHTVQNLKYDTSTITKPLAIITPLSYSHVQSTIICSLKSGIRIRIRSGGHDYEALSSISFDHNPFVLVDLIQLRSVTVDSEAKTAWVESGATLGELHYWVSKKSNLLGFPAGVCSSVGVGGHFSGGGFGMLARKYGLSADNVIDALIVDVNGQILDRDSMGEDLFWAIRGGGGGSFGVVLSWKINLVYVPPIVTVFSITKNDIQLVNKWQYIGHSISDDLFINIRITAFRALDQAENKTMQVTFNSLFLGTADKLIDTMNDIFPELGLYEKDCIEMNWIESVVYFSSYIRGESIDALIERKPWPKGNYKIKADYVRKPIPEEALEEIFKWCLLEENLTIELEPHGGKMSKIDETETPYPHREGNFYMIQYKITWEDEAFESKYIGFIRNIYEKMAPFVSNKPREAYVNFRDLDVGLNGNGCATTYLQAKNWGSKYFKGNFRRLAIIKGKVDPTNFFCYEQSIPPMVLCKEIQILQHRNKKMKCYNHSDFGLHQNI
uniref:berberine bridge enzyme-like 26 n=1 Tax=Erigeron canadensis TaxID=72917 RepID=UPI001CB98652|nr:berberine bridge enzyme-like 26 [Erigeron canadensis]